MPNWVNRMSFLAAASVPCGVVCGNNSMHQRRAGAGQGRKGHMALPCKCYTSWDKQEYYSVQWIASRLQGAKRSSSRRPGHHTLSVACASCGVLPPCWTSAQNTVLYCRCQCAEQGKAGRVVCHPVSRAAPNAGKGEAGGKAAYGRCTHTRPANSTAPSPSLLLVHLYLVVDVGVHLPPGEVVPQGGHIRVAHRAAVEHGRCQQGPLGPHDLRACACGVTHGYEASAPDAPTTKQQTTRSQRVQTQGDCRR